ncbi:MAG: hypothetical protein WBP72_05100 [Rhodocyclaceae bacterium]
MAGLEEKVGQMLAYCEALATENHSLRSQISDLESERRRLTEKIEAVSRRIEDLMAQIPQ